jgi:hypothetical protein
MIILCMNQCAIPVFPPSIHELKPYLHFIARLFIHRKKLKILFVSLKSLKNKFYLCAICSLDKACIIHKIMIFIANIYDPFHFTRLHVLSCCSRWIIKRYNYCYSMYVCLCAPQNVCIIIIHCCALEFKCIEDIFSLLSTTCPYKCV